MPLYEVRCKACGASFEVVNRVLKATDVIVCPLCGSKDTQKQLSIFAPKVSSISSAFSTVSSSSCGSRGSFS